MLNGSINHVDLTVSDPATSGTFYDKVLGRLGYARTSDYEGSVPCWVLSRSGVAVSIALHQARLDAPHNRYSIGLHHLAFHAGSRAAVDSFHEFLLGQDIVVLDAPAEYDYTPGYYAVFFADPDGIKLELVHEPRFDTTAA